MKIGDFAKACDVPISVLRYYDSEGLLKPLYIDRFTGYRYYSEGQKEIYEKIEQLKACGFSLLQIKELLASRETSEVNALFESRRQELETMLLCLKETQAMMEKKSENKKATLVYQENIDLPFVNDEAVVGRWEMLNGETLPHSEKREVYFLPGGEDYWCYRGWTKGLLIFDDGCNTSANPYRLEQREDGLYMTVEYKSYDYWNGGEAETVVLKKLDSKQYNKYDIAVKENTDLPFENDPKVLGKWMVHSFLEKKEDFLKEESKKDFVPYFKAIEFLPNGDCISVYEDTLIDGEEQSWTKGLLLRHFNHTACAYEIQCVEGREYLILEWKSGDYRWGGMETDYYVFVRS